MQNKLLRDQDNITHTWKKSYDQMILFLCSPGYISKYKLTLKFTVVM